MQAGASRARIVDLLGREPGLLATRIGKRLGIHRTTAEYHLRMLQEAGAVVARASAGRPAYFLAGAAPPEPAPALRSASARRILDLARVSPGATIGEAAAAAGVDVSSASHHVRRLREAGLVEVRADGRFRRLFPCG